MQPALPDLRIERVGTEHPDFARLVAEQEREVMARYSATEPGPPLAPGTPALLATVDGAPVGCVAVARLDDDTGEVRRLYVAPPARRGGLARQLMAAAEALAVELGYRRLRLETGSAQPESLALYRSSGWAEIANYGYYRDAPEVVSMEKTVAAAPPARLFTYDHALRAAPAWWRGALAIVMLVAGYFLTSVVFGAAAVFVDLATGASTVDDLADGIPRLTPVLMLANNLALASLWPIAVLTQWAVFGVRPRWMSSVAGLWRWRWMLRLALVIVPVWVVYVGVSLLLGPLDPIELTGSVVAMLLIVVLTTPFQAAGEEFAARGLVQRAVGSWFRHPGVAFAAGTIVSGALFASAHAAADPWLIAYYFVFGASASLAARATGGLEAPVLVHAVNNVLLLVPTALMGQTDQVFERGEGAGSAFLLLPMALCLGVAAFSGWWARRAGVVTRAPLPPTRTRAPARAAPRSPG
ncbi:GNAT family N-acetyltransferase [Herbiconiux sp. KACC 21604]|uniref:GNAT family N-acetyltransferase n=1 Tax=unclassified Herbiconiux TaxID=2618217 RepID=UPI00149233C7|nr:GNAT family N-acetyltransferase [Herbiconiux sp. SALV-R1]QJU54250.1 GNAT family N-acetyltransferase [Herbiconiux sp. SALV-R1]WPO85316.1 GNAT family N-acetyltransferase [Herbiconiux sp. KACC 21604]